MRREERRVRAAGRCARAAERLREMLATGEFPRLAEVLRTRTSHPPPDTFEAGLEWLFDGMEAVLEARRG